MAHNFVKITDEMHPWYGKSLDDEGFRAYDGTIPGPSGAPERKRDWQRARAAWRRATAAKNAKAVHPSLTSTLLKEISEILWEYRETLPIGAVRDRVDRTGKVVSTQLKKAAAREAEAANRMADVRAQRTGKRRAELYLRVTLSDLTEHRCIGYEEAARLLGKGTKQSLQVAMSQQGGMRCSVRHGESYATLEKLMDDGTTMAEATKRQRDLA